MRKLLFAEVQKFHLFWFLLLLFGLGVAIAVAVYSGDLSITTGSSAIAPVAVLVLVIVPLLLLFLNLKLKTRIYADSIELHYSPVKRKYFLRSEIVRTEVVSYQPIAEYGGWGFRYGRGGKAWNVSGNKGIKLHLKNGKHFLIGTNRPEEAAKAIELFMAG